VTIDYTRRPRPVPAPLPVPVPVPVPVPAPVPVPVPRSDPGSPTASRPGFGVVGVAVKLVAGWMAVEAWTNGTVLGAVLLTAVALLCWAPIRQALRYSLAVAAMFVVRALAVRAGRLIEPGRVTDPAAAWRVWLETRCGGCGH
jgi:hypothetical protein